MSYYYKYNFISPEPVYSTVKEELKSYFDTGAVDDLLFPTYLDKCLKKLGRTTYVIAEQPLYIEDFQARLPDNFVAVREAWMCTAIPQYPYQSANSFYSQAASQTTIQVSPYISGTVPCTNPQCTTGCPTCMPELIQAVYKTNNSVARSYQQQYLLKPGNISARGNCDVDYTNAWQFTEYAPPLHEFTPGAASYDSFDIRDNKFVTNFRNGIVHLIFYVTEYDGIGNQMIPDNYRIREFVEAFIKYKVFETLSNQLTDETFQQISQKLAYYKQLHDEAFIMADIEIKKQTPWEKQRRVRNDLQRFAKYELPNRSNRSGWRRN
tara:strand:- start:231 stop:1196 length:966 start_codon:yes stop_codon:yes gene_type:complete